MIDRAYYVELLLGEQRSVGDESDILYSEYDIACRRCSSKTKNNLVSQTGGREKNGVLERQGRG